MIRAAGRLLAIAGIAIAVMVTAAQAQVPEQQQALTLGARVVAGVGYQSQDGQSVGGPAVEVDATLAGYWRDPRIFQFSVEPMVAVGDGLPGSGMSNALTGISAIGIILQGSDMPLNISYTRTSSALDQSTSGPSSAQNSQDVLNGVETNPTSSVLNVSWLLRFRHFPVVLLDYRDSDQNTSLPKQFGGDDDHTQHSFLAHASYGYRGWHTGVWYHRTQNSTTSPDILTGEETSQTDSGTDFGLSAAKTLPLSTYLSAGCDRSTASSDFSGTQENTTMTQANALLSSQPVPRVSTSMQAQYTSNTQAYELQQALSGAGLSTGGGSSTPLTALSAPTSMLSISGGVGARLGNGFGINAGTGESHSSDQSSSTQWNAGPTYTHQWRSGWLSANYSYSSLTSQTEVVTANSTGTAPTTNSGSTVYSLLLENEATNSGSLNLAQDLPRQIKLTASTHGSVGSITENGIQYPDHDYGGMATVTRPIGEWKMTASFTMDKNAANRELIYNQSSSQAYALSASYHRLTLSGGRQYGSGLAYQVGNSLVWVTSPVVVSSVLGNPVSTSSTGTTMTGVYDSRRGRLSLAANWWHFDYVTQGVPPTSSTVFNAYARYRLRRLRILAGFSTQSEQFGSSSSSTYKYKMMYLQVERVFRIF